ncbi:MAG: response regulator [bacterium]|nr:response regulator [bacterium]
MRPQAHKRVMLVEDDETLAEMYAIRLKAEDFDVMRAENGKVALEDIPRFKPDLILLDIMMPEMNGIEVLKYLRHQKETRTIPIFILTALSQGRDRTVGLEAGADDFIIKSETMPKEVVQKVKVALDAASVAHNF